jgi:tRNA G18 (ribose-2'-O)-methylase SpoU
MIEKLYLCGYTPHPPKKEILKTALGSTESVKWEYVKDPVEVITTLKSNGVAICSLELTSESKPYYRQENYNFPICLIVGNEITGVSQELLDLSDFSVEIPQYGIKQSLNVSVAYGIAIFELRKIYDRKNNSGI